MHTIQLEVDDNKLELLLSKLQNFIDEGLVRDINTKNDSSINISFNEAKNRVSKAIEDYKENPEQFKKIDKDFFKDNEKSLIQRYNDADSKAS